MNRTDFIECDSCRLHIGHPLCSGCQDNLDTIRELQSENKRLWELHEKLLPFLCPPDLGKGFGRACIKTAIEMVQAVIAQKQEKDDD